jgi:dihydrodipicolinate synthase/N-acetylneuraminate lyase
MIHGTLAAAVTPLGAGGDEVDEAAVAPLVDFYIEAGLDGLLVLGTTGEGILLHPAERRVVAERFFAAAGNRLAVAVHCGAQTTRDTVALAEHAAAHGAAAVAVIPPPYFALDDASLLRHLAAAAGAASPVPFYVYEFAARSGYAVPIPVLERLREAAPNLAGLKVSDAPFDAVRPYLLTGLDVFIGQEGLICQGLHAGAAGAVSGLAAAFPELTIAAVRTATPEASARADRARQVIQRFPFQSALKAVLRWRGVPISDSVRAPLGALDGPQRRDLERLLADPGSEISAPFQRATGGATR